MKHYKFIYFLAFVLGMSTWAQAQSTPCTGNAYSTNADFFRASASAQSGDATASQKKAVIAARTAITSQIKAKAEMAAKSQKKFGNAEWEQFSDLIHMATQQEAANLKVICENSRQSGGKYKTDVVVELPKAGVLSTIINQIKSDDKLKGLFEESKFKQAFQSHLNPSEESMQFKRKTYYINLILTDLWKSCTITFPSNWLLSFW